MKETNETKETKVRSLSDTWIIFSMNQSTGCRPIKLICSITACCNFPSSGDGAPTSGNRSDMIPSNNGKSCERNYKEKSMHCIINARLMQFIDANLGCQSFCGLCLANNTETVEDEQHFCMICAAYEKHRKTVLKKLGVNFPNVQMSQICHSLYVICHSLFDL